MPSADDVELEEEVDGRSPLPSSSLPGYPLSPIGEAAPLLGTERMSERERCLRIGLTLSGTPWWPETAVDEVE